MVAAKLATLKLGDNQHSEGLPTGRSSELLNVGERTVARALEVIERGASELVQAVERGQVLVSAAADIATMPADDQREIVARGEREILRAPQDIRARKAEIRRAEHIERLAATCNQALRSQATDAMRCFMPIRRGISKSTMKNPASSAQPATTIPRCRSTRTALCRS